MPSLDPMLSLSSAALPKHLPLCVDGRMLGGEGTGVSTFARALLDAAGRMGADPHVLMASHQTDGRAARWIGSLDPSPRRVRPQKSMQEGPGQILGRDIFRRAHVHFNLHRRLMRLKCDLGPGVMHWTYPVPLVMDGWVNLYTVHDVIPLTRPDLTPIDPRRHRAVLREICAHAKGLITVSEAARADIITALGCDPTMVTNCGEPVDVDGERVASDVHGLSHKAYLLFCGSVEPRKNLDAVLAAYRASEVSLPLVVVGPDGWRSEPILRDIARTPGVIRLSYVPRAELLGLIAGARGLVFPSLAEGFGLPLVEAMSLGTAVLTSNCGALAEVAGGAALLDDTLDSDALAGGLKDLATNDAEVHRLVQLGLARSRDFSQQAFVERLTKVYQAAIANETAPAYQQSS